MGAGYLPLTDFDITGDTKYNVKVLTKDCNLYADTNINTKMNLQINPGEQVFVPVNEPSSSKWVPVICAKTLTTFGSGFLPSNILKSTSRISQPA